MIRSECIGWRRGRLLYQTTVRTAELSVRVVIGDWEEGVGIQR